MSEVLYIREVNPMHEPSLMHRAAAIMLSELVHIGDSAYVAKPAEVETYVNRANYMGEVHHVLLDGKGEVIGVSAEDYSDDPKAVLIKRIAIVGTRQRKKHEKNGTRFMLGLAQIALNNGREWMRLHSRRESVPFYDNLGLDLVNEIRGVMLTHAQDLLDRFPHLAGEDSIQIY